MVKLILWKDKISIEWPHRVNCDIVKRIFCILERLNELKKEKRKSTVKELDLTMGD